MLILTRRIGQKVRVNSDIEVVVLGVKENQVRVGINAPLNVSVHREEIYQRIVDGTEYKPENDQSMPMELQEPNKPKLIKKPRINRTDLRRKDIENT